MYIKPLYIRLFCALLSCAALLFAGYQFGNLTGTSAQQFKSVNDNVNAQAKTFNDKVIVGLCGKKGGKASTELNLFGPYVIQCTDKRIFVPGYSQRK